MRNITKSKMLLPVEQFCQMLGHFWRIIPIGENVQKVGRGGKIEPFEKKSKGNAGTRSPGKCKSLGFQIFRERLLTLGQAQHQLQQLLGKPFRVGCLHHVRCLCHLHHEDLEVFVHRVKATRILRQLSADVLGSDED